MRRYVEVLFVGRSRNGINAPVFEVSFEEFEVIRLNLLEIEDAEAPVDVEELFVRVIAREPHPLAAGDRAAAIKHNELISLEYRGK
jgi:hypothetical protein